jgi:hypothetical protein
MFIYFFFALIFLGLYSFDLHKTIKNTIETKYEKVKTLVSLISVNQKNILKIIWICLSLISKTFYVRLCQFFNRSVQKVGKNKYEVSFVLNGILYKFPVHTKRGPRTVLQVLNDKDEDITDVFQQYAGPNEDFYIYKRHHFSPQFFNSESLHILRSTGEELNLKSNDIISL